ncbi:MAG: efflux RND transporter periplasmic adaptor subunit [Gammaproteobacteria bacterium]
MKKRIVLVAIAAGASVAAGVWYAHRSTMDMQAADQEAPHKHQLEQRTDQQGKVYYTCPMHPQVKQNEPGNCPICGMKLVKREEPVADGGAALSGETGDRKILYYYDPMKPDVRFDKPGKSPFMDMQLLPKYADENGGTVVQVDPRIAQNLGVRTAMVERGAFAQEVNVVGAVEVDERRIFVVEARAAGWVEELPVRAVGDPVRRGQRVAGVYSPDLYSAQEELVLASQSGDAGLIRATRQRLILLGASEAQVDEVVRTGKAQRRMAIAAPSNGVVTELNVRQGQQVSPGTPLMRIADLSRVWVTVEIPEAQVGAASKGQGAQARLSAVPGRVFEGRVDYLYPRLEVATRTLRARIVFDNPDGALKPGMYADVALAGSAREDALLVPTEAVIRTGTRTVVLIAEDEGRFRPVEVELGPEHSDRIVVLKGLEEGQRVVVSGQFLIDSEASLRGAYQRLEDRQ